MPAEKHRVWLVVLSLCLLCFGLMVVSYLFSWGIGRLDLPFGQGLIEASTPLGLAFFSAVTILGNSMFVTSFSIPIGLVFILKKQWQNLKLFVCSIGVGSLINYLLKIIFERQRPAFIGAPHQLTSFSFPSGHAMGSVLLFGMLIYLLLPAIKNHRTKTIVIAATVLLILLIGFSRPYLGVHYLTDILAGYCAGLFWLLLLIFADQNQWFGGPPIQQLY